MSEKKVKLRMGMHNRVTIDRWQAIKDDINAGLPISKIAKRHAVSDSTVRKVRRSKNFHEYRLNNDKTLRKPMTVVAPSCGVPFEDYGRKPLFFSPKKVKATNAELSNRLDREAEKTTRGLGTIFLAVLGIIILAMIIVFIYSLSRQA